MMPRPYREVLRRYRHYEESEWSHCGCEERDEELRDIAWNLKEERSHMMKCRYCGEFYIPKEAPPDGIGEAPPDGIGVCNFCCMMEELDARGGNDDD
jgi:hypothetical protein